jgi:hypothetical protein
MLRRLTPELSARLASLPPYVLGSVAAFLVCGTNRFGFYGLSTLT